LIACSKKKAIPTYGCGKDRNRIDPDCADKRPVQAGNSNMKNVIRTCWLSELSRTMPFLVFARAKRFLSRALSSNWGSDVLGIETGVIDKNTYKH